MNTQNEINSINTKIAKLDALGDLTIELMEVALAKGINSLEAFSELQAVDSTLDYIELSISKLEAQLRGIELPNSLEEENEYLNDLLEEKQDEITDWYKYAKELESKLDDAQAELITLRVAQERAAYLNSFDNPRCVIEDERNVFQDYKKLVKKNPNISNQVAADKLGVTTEAIIRFRCILIA